MSSKKEDIIIPYTSLKKYQLNEFIKEKEKGAVFI